MQKPNDLPLDTILIAVDFNEPSVTAARWAARVFSGARIALVSVVEPPPAPPSLAKRFPSTDEIINDARESATKKLNDLAATLGAASSVEARVGRPHEEIMKAADEQSADVIVVGRQDIASSGFARLGAIAQRLLRSSRTPILVVSGEGEARPRNILAAVDDSPMTAVVLRWAGILGAAFSSRATALHVLSSTRSEEGISDALSWLAHRVTESRAPGLEPRVVSGMRRVAETIIAEARSLESDMIVIGSHGAGSLSGMVFGSVAESVVVSAPCPVFVALPVGDARRG